MYYLSNSVASIVGLALFLSFLQAIELDNRTVCVGVEKTVDVRAPYI